MKVSTKTNIGLVRKHNEDSYCYNKEIDLLAVADGMGGHKAGEVASSMAVNILTDQLLKQKEQLQTNPETVLIQAVKEANSQIYLTANANKDQNGMGTTITAAILDKNTFFLAHVGDSRAYLVHKNEIKQLTQDHSLVNEMVKNGNLTEEEANQHPQKNILTRALGTSEEVLVDFYQAQVIKGDTLLLCTDGLSNLISREEMIVLVANAGNLDQIADALVDKAIERGGHDNITVVIGQA